MFKRHKPISKFRHAREMVWPSMGWRRAVKYWRLRIGRMNDSTRSIALGFAIGFGVAFSPLIGTHFFQAAAIAYILRANIMTALIGNCFGNPWTFPFIWWASIEFGANLVSLFGIRTKNQLPEDLGLAALWDIILHKPFDLFLPWMLGGHVLGILSVFVMYPVFYWMVEATKRARRRGKLYKIHQLAREVTSEKKF
jgi:uncharacterized protein (DUF2062 family)